MKPLLLTGFFILNVLAIASTAGTDQAWITGCLLLVQCFIALFLASKASEQGPQKGTVEEIQRKRMGHWRAP